MSAALPAATAAALNQPSRMQITAGALVRRQLMAFLDLKGFQYTEHRGWIESEIIVSGTVFQLQVLARFVEKLG